MATVGALAMLATMAALGMALLARRRAALGLDRLEVVAFGAPLGVVAGSLLLLALAWVYTLSSTTVVLVTLLCAAGAIVLLRRADGVPLPAPVPAVGVVATPGPGLGMSAAEAALHRFGLFPVVVLAAFAIRWAFLWSGALDYDNGLWAGHINIWGDWSQHLGDVANFAWGENFPPDHPRFAGVPYAYHYLASLTAAAMVELGMDPAGALTLHSFLFSCLIALGVFAFARRLTRDRDAAALALIIFLLGGSLGWLLVLDEANRSGDVLATLREHPWDLSEQFAANFRWQNIYFASILPQRAFLYGLPLCLLVFTLLHEAVQRTERAEQTRLFAYAGVVAGLLPFAHLGPLPLLAMVGGTLFFLYPRRGWFLFGAIWAGLTVPQLLLQEATEGGEATRLVWDRGWLANQDPWWWFWLKNLGWFAPLLVVALLDRRLLSPLSRRFLWAFMPVWVIANLVVFQPDPWDNVKLLVYWYLAGSILVAAALTRAWRTSPSLLVRTLVVGVVLSITFSGVLLNYQQAAGKDRYILLSPSELAFAARVRAETPPDAIFAVGLQSNHPVVLLSGRRVVMSYPGWLWPRGLDAGPRERDLRQLYALGPDLERIIADYGIDYVVVGPWEIANFGADLTAWRARYPVVIDEAGYLVFEV